MASKIERLRAKLKNMGEGAKMTGINVLNTGANLVVGSGVAYAEGRLSDDQGEWGFRGVPYAYIGGGIALLGGLYAGAVHRSEYSASLMAAGAGAVGAHLFRTMYESGVTAKANRTTGGRALRSRVPMAGLNSRVQSAASSVPAAKPGFGTIFDNAEVAK